MFVYLEWLFFAAGAWFVTKICLNLRNSINSL